MPHELIDPKVVEKLEKSLAEHIANIYGEELVIDKNDTLEKRILSVATNLEKLG